ncbi:MAG: iron permease [Ferrovum sp.]|jgi:high-affinity iron transporter|nr:iron permease [Ferrovum sp.]
MGASLVILFREVLEAALIVAVVMGASRGLPGRGLWVTGGIVAGLLGAGVLATLAISASSVLSGQGQALFNAFILLLAVGMITWHNVWMAAHSQQIRIELKQVGADVQQGHRPMLALLIVTATALMREGTEAALFLWALLADHTSSRDTLLGGVLGVALGVTAGFVMYQGLVKIPVRHFFTVTRWLLLFIAAGLSAQAAGFLSQAGVIPDLGHGIWNTSAWLDQASWLGQLLHILVGYMARPTGVQVLFYGLTLVSMLFLMMRQQHPHNGSTSK